MNKRSLASWGGLICTALLSSCGGPKDPPITAIEVTDLSASIEMDARGAMVQSVGTVIRDLHRGDSVTIIPLTGDVENEAPGHILRFALSTQREVYDDDVRRVNLAAQKTLGDIAVAAKDRPSSQTDVLGAFRLASEELSGLPASRTAVVIVLSDFIQDDAQVNFNTDEKLASIVTSKALAMKVSSQEGRRFSGTPIFLGTLSSRDLARLGRVRREAIREFWLEYLRQLGAAPEWVIDGPGLAPSFIESIRNRAVETANVQKNLR